MKRALAWLPEIVSKIRSAIDPTDVLFFGGLALLAIGASYFHDGLGLALAGLLLVLYVRPLKGWWMR